MEKAREFQGNIYFCFTDNAKVWPCGPPYLSLEKQVKKQQLELDMEQLTHSKLRKIKALYCHPTYLTCVQEYVVQSTGLDE